MKMFRAGRSSHFSPPVVFYHLGSLQDGKLWLKDLDNKTECLGWVFIRTNMKYMIQGGNLKALSKSAQVCKIVFLILCRFYS